MELQNPAIEQIYISPFFDKGLDMKLAPNLVDFDEWVLNVIIDR